MSEKNWTAYLVIEVLFCFFLWETKKNWNWTLHIVTCWLRTSIISRAFFIFSSKLFILCVKRKTERYSEKIFFSFSRIFHFWGFLMMLILATAMPFFEIFSTKIQYVYMSWFMYEQSPIHWLVIYVSSYGKMSK